MSAAHPPPRPHTAIPGPLQKMQKVAIVGRPNVGKSTLFNRLTGGRDALVSDLPGLTRDRRGGEALIRGQKIILTDTAGLEEAVRGSIAARMREQTETAIASADLVLFVVDARDGVTPADITFAKAVRNSGCPSILVANKCEGYAAQDGIYEMFELGLGTPTAISAEHGEGMSELEDDIGEALGFARPKHVSRRKRAARDFAGSAQYPGDGGDVDAAIEDQAEAATARPMRVAIVGRPNAGKSTLVNAILGEDRMITGPEPGLTRDSIASDITIAGKRLRLFDTAGLRRKSKIDERAEKLSASDSVRAIRFAEVVVVVIDAERGLEQQDLIIAQRVTDEGRALVLAFNKWDLVDDKQAYLKDMCETIAAKLSQVPNVSLVTLSATAEKGLDRLADAIFDAYDTWNKRVSTPEINRWLQAATARHAPPAVGGRRIKLRFMTQPSARPPTFVVFCSRPTDIPKSYLRYLTNGLREAFGLPGVPIRLNLRKGDNPYAPKGKR